MRLPRHGYEHPYVLEKLIFINIFLKRSGFYLLLSSMPLLEVLRPNLPKNTYVESLIFFWNIRISFLLICAGYELNNCSA